jgi:hypothetical protein
VTDSHILGKQPSPRLALALEKSILVSLDMFCSPSPVQLEEVKQALGALEPTSTSTLRSKIEAWKT